jgi:hypothetical protein
MARKIGSYRAHPPAKFELPAVPKKAVFVAEFPSLIPAVEISAPTDIPEYERRMSEWRQKFPVMSDLEFVVMDYLTRKKKWELGREFEYQTPIAGGRTVYGGFLVDFLVRPDLALQPQGERWHLQQPMDRARLRVEKMLLTSRGYEVIYLWESDLLTRTSYTMEAALRRQQLSTFKDVS